MEKAVEGYSCYNISLSKSIDLYLSNACVLTAQSDIGVSLNSGSATSFDDVMAGKSSVPE